MAMKSPPLRKLTNFIKKTTYKPYMVTVEIYIGETFMGQTAVPVQHYNKQQAIKKALRIVEAGAKAKAAGCHQIK